MKISLTAAPSGANFSLILWRGRMEDAFALAQELGYDGVEIHLRHPDDIERTAVRALQEKYNLGVPTLGTGMAANDGLTFSDLDPDVRRCAVVRIHDHIRLAASLGSAVTIGLIRGRLGQDDQRAARRSAMLACLDECCRLAAAQGVTLLLEPIHRYGIDNLATLDQAAQVIRELGAPNLKLLADTFHMNIEEVDMADSLRQHASLLGHVHLPDSNRQVPGHGHIDMKAILQALLETGFQGYLSFEVLPLPNPRQAAVDGMQTVQHILRCLT